MPKIARNFYYENGKLILPTWDGVFLDMPIALFDLGREYKNPVIVELEDNKSNICFEKEELDKLLKEQEEKNKKKGENK